MLYFALKYLHVIGAAVLLGTGAGIAFFMLVAHLRGDPTLIAGVARIVVIADFLFTATAVVVQPVTGRCWPGMTGYSLWERLDRSGRSFFTPSPAHSGCRWSGCRCGCATLRSPQSNRRRQLPAAYHRLFWTWFAFGFPAFAAVLAIFWLMIARPALPSF